MEILHQGVAESEVWKRRPFMKMRRMEIFQYLQKHGITKWNGQDIKPSWFKNDMVVIAEQLHGRPRPLPKVQEQKHKLHDASLASMKQPQLRKILREAGIPTEKSIKKVELLALIDKHKEKLLSHDTA